LLRNPYTLGEAFAAVDQGEIAFTELWDASARRAFSAYEYGAGDNSYGAIFVHGTTTLAASIGDGDLSGCQSFWGAERRRCDADADCESGAAASARRLTPRLAAASTPRATITRPPGRPAPAPTPTSGAPGAPACGAPGARSSTGTRRSAFAGRPG
jgi:hypothetical protein